MNATLERMHKLVGAQDGNDPQRLVLLTSKQPIKPVVTVVRSQISLSAIQIQRSDDSPFPCSGVGQPEENKARMRIPSTIEYCDDGDDGKHDSAIIHRDAFILLDNQKPEDHTGGQSSIVS